MLYVAYGSNINVQQMQTRCPNSTPYAVGAVHGYQLEFNRVATLVKDKTGIAPCVLWNITKEHEAALDRYEGYPYKYVKKMVDVSTDKGEKIKAMAYIMRDSSRLEAPRDDYYDRILDGYMSFELDEHFLEDAYERSIEATVKRYEQYEEQQSRLPFESQDDIDRYRVEGFRAAMEYGTYLGLFEKEDLADIRDSDIKQIIGNFYPRSANSSTLNKRSSRDNEFSLYIAYGSNLDKDQMKYRCPNSTPYAVTTLPDYKLVFDNHATVEPHKGAKTPVMLWKIHKDDWQRLDAYEGFPSYYRKEILTFKYKGEVLDAAIYIMNHGKTYNPPSKGYLDGIEKGYKEAGMDLNCLTDAVRYSLDWRKSLSQKKQPQTEEQKNRKR